MLESGAYITTAIINYIIGVLFGVLAAWKKKVFFWVVLVYIIALLAIAMIFLNEFNKRIELLQTLVGSISSLLGFLSGMKFYEGAYGNK